MKILYGVNTNGQGHLNRSRIIIDELIRDGHTVYVLYDGDKPPSYVRSIGDKRFFVKSLVITYDSKNKFNFLKTTLNSLKYLNPTIIDNLVSFIKKEQFDFILSDSSSMVSIARSRLNIPLIEVDHHHSLIADHIYHRKLKYNYQIIMRIFLFTVIPFQDAYFSIDYLPKILRLENGTVYPLLEKPEFANLNPKKSDFFLIYIKAIAERDVIEILSNYPESKFVVYGFNKDKNVENISFKKTSREGFLEDFVNCRAIITNAGFSSSWEAALLKKPMCIIPVKNQPEQFFNAFKLATLGYAHTLSSLHSKKLKDFILDPEGNSRIEKVVSIPPRVVINDIYDKMDQLNTNQFQKTWQFKIKTRIVNILLSLSNHVN